MKIIFDTRDWKHVEFFERNRAGGESHAGIVWYKPSNWLYLFASELAFLPEWIRNLMDWVRFRLEAVNC